MVSCRAALRLALIAVLGWFCLPAVGAQTSSPPPTPVPAQTSAPAQSSPTPPAPAPTQTPTPPPAATSPQEPALPQGTVLFQSHGEPPVPGLPDPLDPTRKLLPAPAQQPGAEAQHTPANGPELTDRDRSALLFTAYDLDARITPATGKLTVRARVTVQNTSDTPLRRMALQVSSALTWESVSLAGAQTLAPAEHLDFAQHLIDTDTDHTGKASEAIVELAGPLEPGRSLTLDTFYSGTLAQSAERLLRIGATDAQGVAADWDGIGPGGVWLRGFGNVLWYPVSAPQLFLGEGTRLFDAVDQAKRPGQTATVRLRLNVEYTGDPPSAAYFCGRRAAFTAVSDDPDAPTAAGSGVANVEFAAEPLGFRAPSLFVVAKPETLTAPLAGELAGGEPMLAVEVTDDARIPALASATERLVPLLQRWLGARPLSALTVLDHPGQPFQDGPLLVAPAAALTTPDAASALTFSLAHAWVQTGRPWVDEGLAQFFSLLNLEQARGREAMVAQLGELTRPLGQTEPSLTAGEAAPAQADDALEKPAVRDEPLITADSELYFRRKAAAVWLMLREIVGDQALQVTLGAWRLRVPAPPGTQPTAEQDALALEATLEANSGKDLHRFFDDWVLHDRGLPALTLAEVTPRQLPANEAGRNTGWLTVVTVTNAGAAMADIPLIVSSGSFSTTVRLTVPGAADGTPGTATARVQTESAPTEVRVNDGVTPEQGTGVHRRDVRNR